MAEQADAAAHRGAVGAEVAAEHGAAAAGQREQPGADPQQRRLAGAVGSAQQDDLAEPDAEASRRRAPGTSRARRRRRPARRRSPAVDPSPGDATGTVTTRDGSRRRRRRARRDARVVGDRGPAPPRAAPGRQAQVSLGPSAPAARLALGGRHARQGPHRDRAADVRLRRLPAVGHRARVRPGPEPPRRRVRAPPRRGADDDDDTSDDRAAGHDGGLVAAHIGAVDARPRSRRRRACRPSLPAT